MAWGLSPSKYVVQAVKNCQLHLTEKLAGRYSIPARADNPFLVDYAPSTDLSDILDPDCSSFYQHLIGVMRWMAELGRIDIVIEVSMLSSYLACLCEGHLENALHVMGYLQLSITHDSSLTQHTLTLTRLFFHPLNGWSFMATWKKQFLLICLLPLAKMLTFV